MIEARFSAPASLLKNIVEVLKDVVADVNLNVDASGMSLQAMDNSHVCLVTLTLPSSGFQHYRCDAPTSLGLSLLTLSKMLKCCVNDDITTVQYDPSNPDTLTLLFESQRGDRISDFTLKLMDIDCDTLTVPETEYPATLAMASVDFQKMTKDLKEIDDCLSVSVGKDGVKFAVNGAIGSGCTTLRGCQSDDASDDRVEVAFTQPTCASYALRYVCMFAKAATLSSRVEMKIASDLPLCVTYKMDCVGQMTFYLAPKMDDM